MSKITVYWFCLLAYAGLVMSYSAHATDKLVPATEYLKQVAFSEVTALSYADMTQKIAYGQDNNQFIEVWAASGAQEVPPISVGIILVHGGCWLSNYGVDHVRPLASALSQQGYNVFAVEYRRTGQPGGGWPGSLNDVKQGVQLIRETYPKMSLSIAGHSAGGHLAMLTGTDIALRLDAVIGLAAITNPGKYAQGDSGCQKATLSFIGGSEKERVLAYEQANTQNKRIAFPLFLLGGKADTIVPVDQIYHAQARRFIGDDIGHFDWVHPRSEAFQHLLNVLGRLYE